MDFILSLFTATSRLHPTPQYVQTVRTFFCTFLLFDSNTSEMADVGQACAQAPQLTQSEFRKLSSKLLIIRLSNPRPAMLKTISPCTSSYARTHRKQLIHLERSEVM